MAGLRKETAMKSGILIVVLVFGSLGCAEEQSGEGGQVYDDPYEGLTPLHIRAKSAGPGAMEAYLEAGYERP